MKAVIMAGGEGTRLRPLTSGIPKPMVPVMNKPVVEYAINLLKKHQITDIAITTYYLSNYIMDYLGDGSKYDVNIDYFIEETPLGTGGSVLNTGEFLDGTILILSGDVLTDIDLTKAINYHKQKGSKATLILKRETNPLEYGIVIIDENGRIQRFLEKPSWGEVFSDTINTGIYILEKEVFHYYNKGDSFDFSKDLFPRLLKDNIPMFGYVTNEYWNDIGDINSYKQTHFDILDGKVKIDFGARKISDGVYIDEDSIIYDDCRLVPPVYIGKNCTIKSGVLIDAYTIIGNNCTIDETSSLKRTIVWDNCHIGHSVQSRASILCNKVVVKNNVNLYEDSVIGSESLISSNVTINPGIKIWPYKKIKEETVVNNNLVWGTKIAKTLFGNRDISGEINIDITPEFSSLLGSAYANLVKKDKPIIISCDDTNASKAIKNSILSGALSSGVKIIDIENIMLPITRHAIRFYNASGGIHVSLDVYEKNKIHIEFLNENGGNIDRNTEKKLEHLYQRQDFERCNSDGINDVVKVYNYTSLYLNSIIELLKNTSKIKSKRPKVLIASNNETNIYLINRLMQSIGCRTIIDYSLIDIEIKDSIINSIKSRVTNEKIFLGYLINENAETLTVIDDKGNIIDSERYLLLSEIMLGRSGNLSKFIVPYTVTNQVDEIGSCYNIEIVRTKSNLSNIINSMLDSKESDSYNQYLLNFDAFSASAIIIDYLLGNNIDLSDLVNEIPKFHTKQKEIYCDSSQRGRIIRQLIEEHKGQNIELFEGIKINLPHGWALVVPDNEKAKFNLYAEGQTEEYAEEICNEVYDRISKLINIT
ncbi:D-glycero-alpha-D-manno-heptose 1-phosphate guanylyltransferase [Caloramator mitchellensis]|uniref:D-glycero-alpha-D-manno-heptose 1-phosphate guanylyltransferase n=1 Tax=Caloramator mitchellensis TaxID=908809 RepID=A0A0R3JWI1_CALMK|nr:sugar phosphate nucleotidyltransferase [Caloramator mitchellensis]KRQ87880.1 D-glycero-alpha-D-manno-heptose 1-phosphate guanylyltransferase [Caloramator mitchellensis]